MVTLTGVSLKHVADEREGETRSCTRVDKRMEHVMGQVGTCSTVLVECIHLRAFSPWRPEKKASIIVLQVQERNC